MVYGKFRFHPLEFYIKSRMLAFWSRLLTDKASKLYYLMYQSLLQLDMLSIYTSPKIACIKNICNGYGMSGIWQAQNVPDTI